MNRPTDCTLSESLLETLTSQGLNALPQALAVLLNAAPDERTSERTDYANGYKDKTLFTRMEEVTVAVPQVRHGEFYPSTLERGIRSEQALKLALTEMYVQGVSTRKVAAVTEAMCGADPPVPHVAPTRRGSPPRVRGRPVAFLRFPQAHRFTPACAGQT